MVAMTRGFGASSRFPFTNQHVDHTSTRDHIDENEELAGASAAANQVIAMEEGQKNRRKTRRTVVTLADRDRNEIDTEILEP